MLLTEISSSLTGHHADIAPLTVPLVFEFRNGVLADYMQRYWQDIAPAAVPLSECPDIACAVVITDVVTPAMKQARLLIELDAGYTDKPDMKLTFLGTGAADWEQPDESAETASRPAKPSWSAYWATAFSEAPACAHSSPSSVQIF